MKNNKFAKQLEFTLSRFNKFYEPGDFVIGFITDVHTGGNKHYEHYKYFFEYSDEYKVNLFINGGDIGLGLGEDKNEAKRILSNTALYSKTDVPYIFVVGNHDARSQCTTSELYSSLMPQKFTGLEIDTNNGYGVYKIKEQKIAVIFLNTSDCKAKPYDLSKNQIKWLINTLSNIESEYRVIITSHLCMDNIGAWGKSVIDNESVLLTQKIINDFNKHNAGFDSLEKEEISWDFTNKTNIVLFELAGDSHFDNYINRDGLNIIVREGYGGILLEDVAPGGKHYKFSSNEGIDDVKDCLFDIICIKPNNKTHVFRIGVGQEEADLEF